MPDAVRHSIGHSYCAPGMGNNWVVKDHYALGSRKR